jgi:hypothetical protein
MSRHIEFLWFTVVTQRKTREGSSLRRVDLRRVKEVYNYATMIESGLVFVDICEGKVTIPFGHGTRVDATER